MKRRRHPFPRRRDPQSRSSCSDPRHAATSSVRAMIWVSLILSVILVYVLAQPLFLIVGGLVFASMLDGGARLLGRVLNIRSRRAHGGSCWSRWLVLAFLVGVLLLCRASTLVSEFQALKTLVVSQQFARLSRAGPNAIGRAAAGRRRTSMRSASR